MRPARDGNKTFLVLFERDGEELLSTKLDLTPRAHQPTFKMSWIPTSYRGSTAVRGPCPPEHGNRRGGCLTKTLRPLGLKVKP